VPEAIGSMAEKYPEKMEKAIPYFLKDTIDNKINTTVIKWCAAFSLAEIAKGNPKTRKTLLPAFETIIVDPNTLRNIPTPVRHL
jgi:hypothetical protein